MYLAGQIHKFRVFDKNLVLDVNSGSIFEVDNITYDVLDYYNTLSNNDIIAKLKTKYSKLDIEEALKEIKAIETEGYLFSNLDTNAILDKLDTRQYVKALCLNVAHDCNLRCKYCFASKGDYHGKREIMSSEVGKKALEFLAENSGDMEDVEVDFFGGEPLLAMDTVREVISYARILEKTWGKRFHFTITTNAVLLDDETIEYLHKNMDNIVLSLDGRKEVNDFIRVRADGSGSYDKIVPNIKRVVELREKDNKEYYVRGTFTKHNLDFAKDVFHIANLGIREISLEPVVGKEGDYLLEDKDLDTLWKQYDEIANEYMNRKKTGKLPFKFYHFNIDIYNGPCVYKRVWACGAGRDYLAVTPSGDIYPCHQFVGQDEFLMGNVADGKLDQKIVDILKDTHVFAKEECSQCWARYFCSGGCNANNLLICGDMKKPYHITCELQKKRIEYAIYLNLFSSE